MDLAAHIEQLRRRARETEERLSQPEVFQSPARLRELTREFSRLKSCLEMGERYLQAQSQLADNRKMLETEQDPELQAMAREEIARLEAETERLRYKVLEGLLPPNPADTRNTIIEIRAGAGGEESALFAADLYRMFCRYAESRGWKVETMHSHPSDLGGFKEIIFSVSGPDAYRRLKFESGVHRVQRVPATEAQGRIHTSTATVAVLPEAEEVDVAIKPEEVEISVCRASGPGGQGVNTTDSAVQILHKPTGIIVRCADERSQQKNKAKAFRVLRSRLLQRRIEEENAKLARERRSQIGAGERNEKIRTYNFPQNRVTDHRIDLTLYDLRSILDGDLDRLVEPLLERDLKDRLAAAAAAANGSSPNA